MTMDLVKRLEGLGLDYMFAVKTADEIVKLGSTFEQFRAYLQHVHASNQRMQDAKDRYHQRKKRVERLMQWTQYDSVLLSLVSMLLMAPFVLPLTLGSRWAWWRSRRSIQRHFCPWFRQWVNRGIDSDKCVAIVPAEAHPTAQGASR